MTDEAYPRANRWKRFSDWRRAVHFGGLLDEGHDVMGAL